MNLYTIVFYSPVHGKGVIEIEALTATRAKRNIIKKLGRSVHVLTIIKEDADAEHPDMMTKSEYHQILIDCQISSSRF